MKANEQKPKSNRGRKPKYNPERVRIICEALERGETKEMAAQLAGIEYGTFNRWENEKNDFREAVKRSIEAFEDWQLNGILEDAKKSLKVLICGQEYTETKTEFEQDPKNPEKPRVKRQTTTNKKVLPNATAVIFALCNRDPEHWQNRVAQDINGRIETENKGPEISLANVPDDLLAKLVESITGKG